MKKTISKPFMAHQVGKFSPVQMERLIYERDMRDCLENIDEISQELFEIEKRIEDETLDPIKLADLSVELRISMSERQLWRDTLREKRKLLGIPDPLPS